MVLDELSWTSVCVRACTLMTVGCDDRDDDDDDDENAAIVEQVVRTWDGRSKRRCFVQSF